MSTSLLYHAFGVRGYRYVRTDYVEGDVVFTIKQTRNSCRCPVCGSDAAGVAADSAPPPLQENRSICRSLSPELSAVAAVPFDRSKSASPILASP